MTDHIEIQGLILAHSSNAVDHSQFLQELDAFLDKHGWTFSGSTRQTSAPISLLPDISLQAEPPDA